MHNYDFSNLNDKEFEALAIELLSKRENTLIERFKSGKDKGVDGRFFACSRKVGNEVIVQCKHWVKSDLATLLRHLSKEEVEKVNKLIPARYIFVTSQELSRENKKKIALIFAPYIKREDDVLGKDDLNQLLERNPSVEQNHYKLWLTSARILVNIANAALIGRSKAKVTEIVEKSKLYARTSSHLKAHKILEDFNTVIVTGEPGSGKSTLADQLCLDFLANGYNLIVISDEIKEAESMFNPDEKQIFYYDDFLGRNYLQAIENNKDSAICNFIERVKKSKNKKFILTSRTNILNQGHALSDIFKVGKIEKSQHEIRIDGLTKIEKAQILYNHIWFGNLGESYIDQIYFTKRYHDIIKHQNFNPRLISFLVDMEKIHSISPNEYWDYAKSLLSNPSDVWTNLFDSQIDQASRDLVTLVVMNGGSISESELERAYEEFRQKWGIVNAAPVNRSFYNTSKLMVGAMLNRKMNSARVSYDLFNPSIGDFVYRRVVLSSTFFRYTLVLRNATAYKVLGDLYKNGFLVRENYLYAVRSILEVEMEKPKISVNYLLSLTQFSMELISTDKKISKKFLPYFISVFSLEDADFSDAIRVFRDLIGIYNSEELKSFAAELLDVEFDHLETATLNSAIDLARMVNEDIATSVESSIRKAIVELWSDELTQQVYETEIFSGINPNDISRRSDIVYDALEEWLSDYNIEFTETEIGNLVEKCDLEKVKEKVFERLDRDYDDDYDKYRDQESESAFVSEDSKIDDIFERE